MVTQILANLNIGEMLPKMMDFINNMSPDLSQIKKNYEESIHILRQEIGDKKVDAFLRAVNQRCETDLLFCGNLGYQSNLQNFRNPVARTFLDVDFEDYLRIEVLYKMPRRYEADTEIENFCHSLDKGQKEFYDDIIAYLVSLELVLTKLAHYVGFMFANDMLTYTEPGYAPNDILSLRYQKFMCSWFGRSFR